MHFSVVHSQDPIYDKSHPKAEQGDNVEESQRLIITNYSN